jgi:hypothetical protein
MNQLFRRLVLGALISFPAVGLAQESQVHEMRRHVDVLSSALRESLGLSARAGVFSPRAGDITGRYLARQGVLLEISTPLQAGRLPTGLSMENLSQSLDELSVQLSGLMERGLVVRPDMEAIRDAMALSLRTDEAGRFYRDQIQSLTDFESMATVERVLASSASALQRMQSAGHLDGAELGSLSTELQRLRQQLLQRVRGVEDLRREIRELAANTDSLPEQPILERWQLAREALVDGMSGLRQEVAQHAAAVDIAQQRWRQQQVEQRELELAGFEMTLFGTLCDYAGGLREMPQHEYLTIVLRGVAEEDGSGGRRDRVYVLAQSALQQCVRSVITPAQLLQQAETYSY